MARRLTAAERRVRLVTRHGLHPEHRPSDVVGATASVVALHASDPASVYLSARARLGSFSAAELDNALYVEDTLVKHLCMRRTLFVLPGELLPAVQAASSDGVAAAMRRRLVAQLEGGGVAADGARWLAATEVATVAALDDLSEATGAQLSRAIPALRAKMIISPDKKWGGEIGAATRVLSLMAVEGRIRRGPPNGAWTSSHHRWQPADHRRVEAIPEQKATAELVRRWLGAFGPGTPEDIAWWSGLGKGRIRAALDDVGAEEVDLDEGTGFVLADDLDATPPPSECAVLLPSLDPTAMGWKHRGFYGGDQRAPENAELYDRNGNIAPTVWWDGRIVGAWVQRKPLEDAGQGEVVWELHHDIGAEGEAAVAREAEALSAWLGDVVVTPRFPTPVDRRLRG